MDGPTAHKYGKLKEEDSSPIPTSESDWEDTKQWDEPEDYETVLLGGQKPHKCKHGKNKKL